MQLDEKKRPSDRPNLTYLCRILLKNFYPDLWTTHCSSASPDQGVIKEITKAITNGRENQNNNSTSPSGATATGDHDEESKFLHFHHEKCVMIVFFLLLNYCSKRLPMGEMLGKRNEDLNSYGMPPILGDVVQVLIAELLSAGKGTEYIHLYLYKQKEYLPILTAARAKDRGFLIQMTQFVEFLVLKDELREVMVDLIERDDNIWGLTIEIVYEATYRGKFELRSWLKKITYDKDKSKILIREAAHFLWKELNKKGANPNMIGVFLTALFSEFSDTDPHINEVVNLAKNKFPNYFEHLGGSNNKKGEDNSNMRSSGLMNKSSSSSSSAPNAGFNQDKDDPVQMDAVKLFTSLYTFKLELDDFIGVLKRMRNSPKTSHEYQLYERILGSLCDECRYFPKYPLQELLVTGRLFGMLIKNDLITQVRLGLVLKSVLEALRLKSTSRMFLAFGLVALEEFMDQLPRWPQFLHQVTQIPHLRDFYPDLVTYAQEVLNALPVPLRNSQQLESIVLANFPLPMAPPKRGDLENLIRKADDHNKQEQSQPSSPTGSTMPGNNSQVKQGINITSVVKGELGAAAASGNNNNNRPPVPVQTNNKDEIKVVVNTPDDLLSEKALGVENIPPVWFTEKLTVILNFLGNDNAREQAAKTQDLIAESGLPDDLIYPWFAYHIVKKRAAKEPNLQGVLSEFLDHLPKLSTAAVDTTYECIRILILLNNNIELSVQFTSFRTVMKNLGQWLGQITLKKNKVFKKNFLDLKTLLKDAFINGQLTAALPLVCKILEGVKDSKVYRLPNPWTSALLSFLHELHELPGLKTNLLFHIEVLSKHLNISLSETAPTDILNGVLPLNSNDFAGDVTAANVGNPNVGEINNNISNVDNKKRLLTQELNFHSVMGLGEKQKGYLTEVLERACAETVAEMEPGVQICTRSCSEILRQDFGPKPDERIYKKAAHYMVSSLTSSLTGITVRPRLHSRAVSYIREVLLLQSQKVAMQADTLAEQIFVENANTLVNVIDNVLIEQATKEVELELMKPGTRVSNALYSKIPQALRFQNSEQLQVYRDFMNVGVNAKEDFAQLHNQVHQLEQKGINNNSNHNTSSSMGNNSKNNNKMESNNINENMNQQNANINHHDVNKMKEQQSNNGPSTSIPPSLSGGQSNSLPPLPPFLLDFIMNLNKVDWDNMPRVSPSEGMKLLEANKVGYGLQLVQSMHHMLDGIRREQDGFWMELAGRNIHPLLPHNEDTLRYSNEQLLGYVCAATVADAMVEKSHTVRQEACIVMLHSMMRDCRLTELPKTIPKFLKKPRKNTTLEGGVGKMMDAHSIIHKASLYNKSLVMSLVHRDLIDMPTLDSCFLHGLEALYSHTAFLLKDFVAHNLKSGQLDSLPGKNGIHNYANSNAGLQKCAVVLRSIMAMSFSFPDMEYSSLFMKTCIACTQPSTNQSEHHLKYRKQLQSMYSDPASAHCVNTLFHHWGLDIYRLGSPESLGSGPVIYELQARPDLNFEEFSAQTTMFTDVEPALEKRLKYLLETWTQVFYEKPNTGVGVTDMHRFVSYHEFMNKFLSGGVMSGALLPLLTYYGVRYCIDSEISFDQQVERVDAFTRLIGMWRVGLTGVLGTISHCLLKECRAKGGAWKNQRIYYRMINMLMRDSLEMPGFSENVNEPQFLGKLCDFVRFLMHTSPLIVPQFAVAWIDLVAHRYFLPKLMQLDKVGWFCVYRLLSSVLLFMYNPQRVNGDKNKNQEETSLNEGVKKMHSAVLKLLMMLWNDFPEFLAMYAIPLAAVLPEKMSQIRNIIVSAARERNLPEINLGERFFRGDTTTFPSIVQQPRIIFPVLESAGTASLEQVRNKMFLHKVDQVCCMTKYDSVVIAGFLMDVHNYQGLKRIQKWQVYRRVLESFDCEGVRAFIIQMLNHLRYPNAHTHFFASAILFLFEHVSKTSIREQITRCLLERLVVSKPHPWGVLITVVELIKNERYQFWSYPFVHRAPDEVINVLKSVYEMHAKVDPRGAGDMASYQ